jgi:transcriptional regulator with XRE-family HTH domain
MTDFDLRAFREKHSFSQTDLAELWDVTQNMISKFEQADTPPAITRYAAQALEEELTGEKPEAEDTEPLKARIAELEAALAKQEAKPAPKAQTTEQPQPKRSRGLGRPKSAAPRD